MQLSDRLNAIINLASKADCLADIGCDHGFISIELINRKIVDKMIAMDVREGPLSRAKEHIEALKLDRLIETRLSDGVSALEKGEADGIIVAGMGGNLVIHILEEGSEIISDMSQCVLQPQSEIPKVRRYLRENGFVTLEENMILEDGKYYPMMKVKPQKSKFCESANNDEIELYDCYGELLLKQKNIILKKFLEKRLNSLNEIITNLSKKEELYRDRIGELNKERELVCMALDRFF